MAVLAGTSKMVIGLSTIWSLKMAQAFGCKYVIREYSLNFYVENMLENVLNNSNQTNTPQAQLC